MQVFFSKNIVGNKILIDQQEHIHLSKVLRKTVGDEVFVCNGNGLLLKAEIVSCTKRETALLVKETISNVSANPHKLHIAIAPTKNMDRIEWMVEKCIEIGVGGIQTFYSQNSERRRLKIERLEARALSALKQSKALFLPQLEEPKKFKDFIQQNFEGQHKYIAYVEEHTSDVREEFATLDKDCELTVLVGPEGGFTAEEVKLAMDCGFKPISLGEQRLRTETAGVFVAAAYQLLNK